MLNVLHGRFVANPAQNSPSHIMKGGRGGGEKAQMSTVSHWDWIRHPRVTPTAPHPPSPHLLLFLSSRARLSGPFSSLLSLHFCARAKLTRARIESCIRRDERDTTVAPDPPTQWSSILLRQTSVKPSVERPTHF